MREKIRIFGCLWAISALLPAGPVLAQEGELGKTEKPFFEIPLDYSKEELDYPIVTDENYPFLEADNFKEIEKE